MLTLEVFLTPDCLSVPAATELATKAVQSLGQFHLIFKDETKHEQQTKALGIFITPAFVVGSKIIAIGTPTVDELICCLQQRLND